MIRESQEGAYLGLAAAPPSDLKVIHCDPHFDVIDQGRRRWVLGKCSRLPDDEDPGEGRFGIDFHRALPPFREPSGFRCDWGEGPIEVNAFMYARHLPKALRFREFTATMAFAAHGEEDYQAKRRVYEKFYEYVFTPASQVVVATPHSGQVRRPPDSYHPFPQSDIDAWTARVAMNCRPRPPGGRRLLVSLHSTDYFGMLMDVGDFGLPQNQGLAQALGRLKERFAPAVTKVLPAYREHILPYTAMRLQWMAKRWGTLGPEQLSSRSTAVRFEVVHLDRLTGSRVAPHKRFTLEGLLEGLERYWDRPAGDFLALNGVFSGRKTAQLLTLGENLKAAGMDTAVQVEVSRFLAREHPNLAAAMVEALSEEIFQAAD